MKEIESKRDFPGAATMAYKLFQYRHQYKDRSTLTLFGGDFFGTSELSIRTEGEYAPEILNAFNIDYAIYGNHEFDHGLGSDDTTYLKKFTMNSLHSDICGFDH